MSRQLTARSTLETLKKEAKRWLKALQAGDAQARRRLLAVTPTAPTEPGLRDVQLALAREHGLPGWATLCEALEDARRAYAERVELVLRSPDWAGDHATGARLLARWDDSLWPLARASLVSSGLKHSSIRSFIPPSCGEGPVVRRR